MLTRAIKERSWLFAEELCVLLNNRMRGATIALEGSGLKIILDERIPEEILFFKDAIKSLEAKKAENVPKELLKKVVSLKLSGQVFPEQLKESPPQYLERLDLSDTVWGWELVKALVAPSSCFAYTVDVKNPSDSIRCLASVGASEVGYRN